MDRRTLFFVLGLTFTLFLVNLFFEQRNAEERRKWGEQQLARKEEQLKKLQDEVSQRTASSLPVAFLYADSAAQQKLAVGIQGEKAVLVLAWDKDLPKQVYIKGPSDQPVALSLAKPPLAVGDPVIYRQNETAALRVGRLPQLGKYDVQLVVPAEEDPYYKIYLGEYTDGSIEIPAKKIASLKQEVDSKQEVAPLKIAEAFALLKIDDEFVPVAIYDGEQDVLEPLDVLPGLQELVTKPRLKSVAANGQRPSEKFYVLDTPYQQLVFSNYGGALAEINLPFHSKTNEQSVVKEIEFDRDMVKNHPYNARFPAHAYYTAGEGSGLEEHAEGVLGGYYPLLRRDLIQKDKRKSVRVPPRYYGLNIVSEFPETAELVYEVKKLTKDSIVFETVQGHRRITKTYSVANAAKAPYTIDLTINVEGDSRGLWLTSGIPEVEWISGAPVPSLKYRTTRNQKAEVISIDLPKSSVTVTSAYLDWLCNSNGFLGMIMDPLAEADPGYRAQMVPGTVVPSRLVEIDDEYERFKAEDMPGYMLMLPLKSGGGTMHLRIFAGPFATNILKTVDSVYSNPETGYNPDYIACQTFHGWFAFISEPFAKFLFVLMNFFHTLTGSWGFSIILLTVALRIMLYPLNAWSTKSMVRMQQIAPEVTAIQEKYKKDPKKAQLEIMNLYRDRGVNPVSGCFPLLIQMPFLIGMFDLLKSTFELRGASFIPGWIEDLTAPDVLFSWKMPLPFIGNQFHLLPILLGVVMFLQQRLMSTLPKDPSLWTEQQRQQRFMGTVMAIVFTVMFYHFPSGLNIYWLSSMLLGIVQQYWTTKHMKAAPSVEVLPKKK